MLAVAGRWDQLGGRLYGIVNALSLADLFGLECRFVWPHGPDLLLDNRRELFSRRCLEALELDPAALQGCHAIHDHELIAIEEPEVRRRLANADANAFVDVQALFGCLTAAWEGPMAAGERFRRQWREIEWSDTLRRLLEAMSSRPSEEAVSGVHVRAGNILEGEWGQTVAHEKYFPTQIVEQALAQLTRGGSEQVLVVSDNREYLNWLRERYPTILSAEDVIPAYVELTEAQRAFAEILALSRCSPIVGPPSSAFSRLAADLADNPLTRTDAFLAAGEELELLRAGIETRRREVDAHSFWRPLLSRDICWYVDVFGDGLSVAEEHRLAREAAELDPRFSGAASRRARAAAALGHDEEAVNAVAAAMKLAEPVERADDALLEALASDIVVRCLGVACSAPRAFGRFAQVARFRQRRSEDEARLGGASSASKLSLARASTLHPYWAERDHVLGRLEALIQAAEHIAEQPSRRRRRIARCLAGASNGGVDPEAALSGLAVHRSVRLYEPLRRDLDRIVQRLSDAIDSTAR